MEEAGYACADWARNMQEAEEVLDWLSELGVAFALVVGNLSSLDTSGNDGRWIAINIRATDPEILIISISGYRQIEGTDEPYDKYDAAVELPDDLPLLLADHKHS